MRRGVDGPALRMVPALVARRPAALVFELLLGGLICDEIVGGLVRLAYDVGEIGIDDMKSLV